MSSGPESPRAESGSALVDFLLVAVLVTVLVLGVVQLALVLHVRTVLIDSAAEGARYAALEGSSLTGGAARTRWLIDSTLPSRYADQVEIGRADFRGVDVVEVRVSAPVPVLGLLGPSGMIDVTGRAVDEQR
ncbi:TadE/TadG family type IV pilus assembly protein [Ruania albidiflava]|uniref:TadE/TadG family type IV pilus assembly protein n=2 Tax=Ruania albidiflava TaxID=366586 RepID=UPI0003B5632C|nr:TadE/TadG family type IV pilus assembly protein [Ruania albidiflava]